MLSVMQFTKVAGGGRKKIDRIVIHTAECRCKKGSARAVRNYFEHCSTASAHWAVDTFEAVQCVPEEYIAWHAPGANASSVGVELCAYAKDDWKDPDHLALLDNAAHLAALICLGWDIPAVWLDEEKLRLGHRGITGHLECTNVYCQGKGHVDPGPAFPRLAFARSVATLLPRLSPEDPTVGQ